MVFILNAIFVNAAGVLSVQLSVDKTSVKSGETFTYTINYSYSSNTDAAEHVVITDVLPDGVEYVSSNITSDVNHVTVSGQTVSFIFNSPLNAGVTGMVKITARFKAGTTPNNTTATNSVSIYADSIATLSSNTVNVTATTDTADWSVAKSKLVPLSSDPVPDSSVQYKIDITSNSIIGGQNLKDVVVVDTLPLNAVWENASDSGMYSETLDPNTGDVIGKKVTWTIPTLNVGSSKSVFVTVKYPSTKFNIGDSITNVVDGTAKLFDNSNAPDITAQCSHSIATPDFAIGNITKNGRQSNDRYSVGQTAEFAIGNIRNLSNVPIDKITIVDNIPAKITLTKVSVGKYSSFANVKVSYQKNTNPGFWEDWGGSIAVPNNEILNVADLGLADGDYVTSVMWELTYATGIPVGIANTQNLSVIGIVGGASGDTITNTAQLTASLAGQIDKTSSASKTISVIDPMPWFQPTKTAVGGTTYNYDDTVTFKLKVQNHNFATGDYVNPTLIDLLPPEFEVALYNGVLGTDWINGSGADITDVTYTTSSKNIGGKDYQVLKWNCTGTLEPGEYVEVIFSAKIRHLTTMGYITNEMYISTQDNAILLENNDESVLDANDIDGDGSTNDRFVKSQSKIFVKFQGRLSAEKWIRGELDTDTWNHTPDYSMTLPGGVVDYKLVVKNTESNGPISNIVIIDKLPRIGDTGVIDPSGRDSQWSPYLINMITGVNGVALPAGVQIYYTTNASPSLEELSDTINKHGQGGDLWSLTPPADITTVKALKFVFNGITLNPGESISLQWPMRAPVGTVVGEIAWNSFAYGATYKDSNSIEAPLVDESFLPAEPVKVGHQISNDLPGRYHLGNYVWEDMNKNGLQDVGESGINGILVNLYKDDGSFIKYTRTGNNQSGIPGFYDFPNIPDGDYKVEFVYPAEYKVTTINAGADAGLDSDIIDTVIDAVDNGPKKSVKTGTISINGANIDNVDAGLYKLASIGDKVWNDYDTNGNQNESTGIAGITVKLLNEVGDTVIDTTTTDGSGNYSFTNLDPGNYKVQFFNPLSKYKFTTPNAGGVSSTSNSDAIEEADGSTATTGVITIVSGESITSVDAGMYLAQIGDMVWIDMNANGIKDAGDNGIDNVVVRLYNADGLTQATNAFGTAVNSVTTSGGGIYKFDNLVEGNYIVKFEKPVAYEKYSPKDAGANDTTDSDVDTTTGKTDVISLARGGRDTTVDCGIYKLAKIGDKVWNDTNADGDQDDVGTEPGIQNITVELLRASDNFVLSSVVTNSSGVYGFANIEPGNYKLRFHNTDAISYKFSPFSGPGPAVNSDASEDAGGATGTTVLITLKSGDDNTSVDAGMYLAEIGDLVWEDLDADGIIDAGENGIESVKVNLYGADGVTPAVNAYGVVVPQALTSSTGAYKFDNLVAGNYVVEFIKPDGYHSYSTKDAGANNTIDSDVDASTGKTDVITLTRGGRDYSIDCGFYNLASLGNKVWNDTNADGDQDAGENGISSVTVELLNGTTDQIITTTSTNASGLYSFINLIPGNYKVKFYKPTEYDKISPVNVGADDVDSDGIYVLDSDSTAITAAISINSGENIDTVDLGLYNIGKLGDLVWNDLNANGIQDAGEVGVAGVTVKLNDLGNNTIMTTTTDVNGTYSFTQIPVGTYYVQFVLPVGFDKVTLSNIGNSTLDSNADATGKTSNIAVTYESIDITIDGGIYKYATIGNLVWDDYNKNGIQENGEAGISGVTVELYDSIGILKSTTTTGADGTYSFANLIPGQYKVRVIKPVNYLIVDKEQGADTQLDSNIGADGTTDFVTLVSGQIENSVDAGLYKKAGVGDYVWKDANNNGTQDISENGIASVLLKLYDSADNELTSTMTDANGLYKFDNLEPGNYKIKITTPNGMMETYEFDGLRDLRQNVVLGSGDNNVDIDFGFNYIPVIPNNPPTVENYSLETPINTPVTGTVIGEDVDEDILFYSKNSEPANGTVTITREGAWKYTPNEDFLGVDKFEVVVEDFRGGKAISIITITIENPVYDLTGTITEVKSGKKVIGAQVLFKDIAGNVIYSTVSDNNGKYLIEEVKLGNYIMEVTKLGYSGVSTATTVQPEKPTQKHIIRDAVLANIGISLVANPSTVVGDGIQTSLLTTTVTDENNKPISGVSVVFSAGAGTFPNGNTSVTDSNGKASVLFKSDKIEGVNSRLVPIKAKVDDESRKLHAEDQIFMTFEPGSIQGIVVDNATGLPIQGAKVIVSKDFDGDGVIDFYSEMITGNDGRYKIAIPKGGINYNVEISKPFIIGNETVYHTFKQVTNAGEISGSQSETFDANKTAAGLILYSNTDGTVTQFDNYSNYSISVFEKNALYDENGLIKTGGNVTPEYDNIDAQSGTFIVDNLEKNKVYTFATMYEFESGKKIIVGTVDVNIGSDGELNICSTLIDPYGDITDAITGELIEGAFVQLHYADTQRNRDAGIEPDTLVNLPILDNFPPANNVNPQYSDENGKYAYMVFPTTDYYVTATMEGYEDYTSDTITVELEIVRHNFKMMPEDKVVADEEIDEEVTVEETDEEVDNGNHEQIEENQSGDNEVADNEPVENEDNNNQTEDDTTTTVEDDETQLPQENQETTEVIVEESEKSETAHNNEGSIGEQGAGKNQVLPKTGVLFDIRLLEALLALLVLSAIVLKRNTKKHQS